MSRTTHPFEESHEHPFPHRTYPRLRGSRRLHNRLFELDLGPLALAICSASTPADHRLIDALLADVGAEHFPQAFLAAMAKEDTGNVAKKVKNKGYVKVLEQPTDTNGQKLVIHLQDEGGGASDFEIHISW